MAHQTETQIIMGGTVYSGIPGREITRVMINRNLSPAIYNPVTGKWEL